MDKVLSYEQYKELITTAKNKGWKLSNCFFLPAVVRQKIVDGTLSCLAINNGLIFLDNIGDFYRCYYYLSDTAPLERLSLDKKSVIEFPYNGVLNEKQIIQINRIEELGFQLGRESALMSATLEQLIKRCPDSATNVVLCADKQDVLKVFDLIKRYFNPLYAFLPTLRELENAISQNRILVIRNGDTIIAALLSSFEKKIATIEQVAVHEGYRGKGLGNIIVQSYHEKYANEAVMFQHWVDL